MRHRDLFCQIAQPCFARLAMDSFMNTVMGSQPRGLHNFISEIRNVKSKEEERERVNKELGNIRSKFSAAASLTSYQKKKYIWKLCYVYMLGYEVDFGHIEFISLLGSQHYAEKSVGYMAVALLLKPGDKLLDLVVNSVRNDLQSNQMFAKTLALSAIANVGGNEFAESLTQDVSKMITVPYDTGASFLPPTASNPKADPAEVVRNRNAIIKKTCLCLLRMYRTNADCLHPSDWVSYASKLIEDRDLGVVTSAMSLILGLMSHNVDVFEPLLPYVLDLLKKLLTGTSANVPLEYTYYRMASPWIMCKCLRFLQYFKEPEGPEWDKLEKCLNQILFNVQDTENVNKANAEYAVTFEAMNLVVSWGPASTENATHSELRSKTHTLLGKYIAVRDANVRYLALDMLARVSKVDGHADVQQYQDIVCSCLSEADMSVQKRALDVIFVITDAGIVEYVVSELISALSTAESDIREEIVVKAAILAERYQDNIQWYLDSMIEMIVLAGDQVAEAVWYRIVQVVTNAPDVHEYAARKLLEAVQEKKVHEVCICLAGYLLGEIGFVICDQQGCSGFEQFAALHQHFLLLSEKAQSILLTCYCKLMNQYPDLSDNIFAVFNKLSESAALELQQRSCEYMALADQGSEMMATVLERMPVYEEDGKESVLHTIEEAKEANKATSDKASWKVSSDEKAASRENQKVNPRDARATSADSGHGNAPALPPAAPSQASPPAPPIDLLSMDDDGLGASSTTPNFSTNSQENEKIQQNFNAACVAGVNKVQLYDDGHVTIFVQSQFRAHQARMTVSIFNKGTAGEVSNIAYDLPLNQIEGLALRVQEPTVNKVGPHDENKLQVAVACMRPFDQSPEMTVSYSTSTGAAKRTKLRLPITAASFMEPMTCNRDVYMQRWRALEQDKIEEQQTFKAGMGGISIDETVVGKMRTNLIPKLNIGLAEGLDTAMTITGCTSFRTGTPGADGQPIAVGSMLRIEADKASGMFRITIRSKNATVARALLEAVKAQLS